MGNVVSKDISLLDKWIWRYAVKSYSLWHEAIRSKYGWQAESMGCYCRIEHFMIESLEGGGWGQNFF